MGRVQGTLAHLAAGLLGGSRIRKGLLLVVFVGARAPAELVAVWLAGSRRLSYLDVDP